MSGRKLLSSRTPKGKNPLAIALRQAANSIGNQKTHPLTPFFKRIAYKKGRNAAITATARKLAVIIWNMIIKSQHYIQHDLQTLTEKRKNAQILNIKKRLFRLNLTETEMNTIFQKTSLSVT
ncbi:MAG: hypothetical protein BGO55_03835 [Sphingobacteriales bacterium 50-39]|nr:hypothetical protein [Sphingobacteriales bacterium]OJW55679.1 MAG: hypothetical protein BGO55_03835 [Sphingobacteriales bacterium 50-39]